MTGADFQIGGKQGAMLSLPGFCINRRIKYYRIRNYSGNGNNSDNWSTLNVPVLKTEEK